MKIFSCLVALWLAGLSLCAAQVLEWSTPLGTVTLFGSGDLETSLSTEATLGDVVDTNSLAYLDTSALPATSLAEAVEDDSSFVTTAQLSVTESQTSGLPFVDGGISFDSTATDIGSGSGSIVVSLLIQVPTPVLIQLSDIRSSFTDASDVAFSINLYESDASGAKIGDALLSFSGSNFDASGSWESSAPYYLLEMTATASATVEASSGVDFSYALGLDALPVPEPETTTLLLSAVAAGLAIRAARRHSRG